MKEAILEYVGREEARQKFTAAAVASFEHYKETGLHVTLDEFNHWVDAVQSQADAPAPVCHGYGLPRERWPTSRVCIDFCRSRTPTPPSAPC